MNNLSFSQWSLAISGAVLCHVALAINWFGLEPPKTERSAGAPIQIVGSLAAFSEHKAVEETVTELVEPVEDPAEVPVEEISETKPDTQTYEPKPVAELKPVEDVAAEAAIPLTSKPVKQEKKKVKKKKEIKKPKKVAKKAKKKTKKRHAGKRVAALQKGGGAKGKQRKVAGRAAIANYRGRVQSHLARYKRSPGAGHRGRAVVSFSLSRSGGVSGVRLVRSSGNSAIDRATLAMVRRASPFPPMPAGGPGRMRFSVPVSYR